MSDHNPHHGHGQHDSDHGQVESSALSPKPILLFMAVLFVATAFVFIVVKGLDWGFKKLDETSPAQTATDVQAGRQIPPEPVLQGAPGQGSTATKNVPTTLPLEAMEILREQTTKKLGSYGWVDKPGGVAHIPIDRAKSMLAERGLPALPSPTITEELQTAEVVRKEVLNAGPSGGQMLKITGQSQQPAQQPAPQPAQPQDQQPQQNQQQVPPHQH
jgi:hypothetical protein